MFAQSRVREALEEAEWILAHPSTDRSEQPRTTAASAWARVALGDLDGAERAAGRTVELATAVDDGPSTHAAHVTLGVVARMRGWAAAGLGHLDQADQVARRSAKPVGEQNPADVWRGMLLFDLDRTDEAIDALRRGQTRAEAGGVGMLEAMYHAAMGWVLMAMGEVDDAAAECRSGLDLAVDLGTGWRLGSYGALVSLAVRGDDLAGAVEMLDAGRWLSAAHRRATSARPVPPGRGRAVGSPGASRRRDRTSSSMSGEGTCATTCTGRCHSSLRTWPGSWWPPGEWR